MAMEQDFHSVNMNGSASDDALELSSTYTSPALSSLQSTTTSSVSSPPIHSPPADLPHAAQPHSSARLPPWQPVTREQALKSLKESTPHTMILRQLLKNERAHQKDALWHKKSVRRLSKDLYQIVSIYALLQGVLFTAIAQSTMYTCADWWGPVGIVGAVTLGTISCTLDKLHLMGHRKQDVKKFERRQSAVYDKIAQLYARGSACCIDSLEPGHRELFDAEPGIVCIFSMQGLLVLGFLAGFSMLIIVSCTVMLCRPCRCQ